MTPTRRIISALLMLFLCSAAHCGSNWDNFLQNISKENLLELEAAISSGRGNCSQTPMPTRKETRQLLMLVQDANDTALRAALLVSNCMGVGELEDFYRATGIYFEQQPSTFLQIIREFKISDQNLRYMVTMLPLSLVDNFNAKISTVTKRIQIVGNFSEAPLDVIQLRVIAFLQAEKNNLQKINADVELRN